MSGNENSENMYRYYLDQINGTIDCLYVTSNSCEKNRLLNRLRRYLSELDTLTRNLLSGADSAGEPENVRVFTPAELAGYDGKNGKPAFVAVNGTVHDVTNTASWGAATHFGLTAGKDVTKEFSACHAGQPVLRNLRVVGKMTG